MRRQAWMVALFPRWSSEDGNPADASACAVAPDPGCRAVVHLDDRPAGADDLFLDPALQPARYRLGAIRWPRELPLFPHRPGLSRLAPEHAGAGRLGAAADDPARHSLGAAAR